MGVAELNQSELVDSAKLNAVGNVANELADRIKRLIVTGKLPSGFRFVNENAFCEQLGVGRSSLREAYKVLESQGCILRTKRGTYVNDLDKFIMNLPFEMAIESTDFNDMIEFRTMFEAEISALAAQRATPENLGNMGLYLEKMQENRFDLKSLTAYDMQFHMEIARASHNKLLLNTMQMSSAVFSKGILEGFQKGGQAMVTQAIAYHESIMLAIKIKDTSMAQATMRAHVKHVIGVITKES